MKFQLVSVIIPTYNEEKYIKKCIKTIKNQSYKYLEIIIVDDGSTDNTLKIIKSFKRFNLLKQEHKGPGIARNYGAKIAKGKILVFIDADMEFDRDYIKNLVKPILEGKAFGTIHSIEEIANKNNKWAICWGPRPTIDKNNEGLIYRAILRNNFFEYGPFNPKLGYADDQTLYLKSGKKALGVNAICYHNNPSTLKEVFIQSKWIGSSYRNKIIEIPVLNFIFSLLFLIFIPILIFKNILKTFLNTKRISFLLYYPIFGIFKYVGNFVGVNKKIFFGKNIK